MTKWFEDNVQSVEQAAGEKLGKARFLAYGKSAYPDATFTLRLSYGTLKGYPMNAPRPPTRRPSTGSTTAPTASISRHLLICPLATARRLGNWTLPGLLTLSAPAMWSEGNSGSPVINRNAELVGLIFDGNIESLAGDFVYDEETNRAVAVHSAAMIEALRKLYGAGKLADELEGARP